MCNKGKCIENKNKGNGEGVDKRVREGQGKVNRE